MPLYEYVCDDCAAKFERLRPMSRMDDAASCPSGHASGRRVLSTFAALTRDSAGEVASVGGGGCGGCSGGNCAGCACSTN
ncbi:MAG: zinc ribbon domain-containing protein [Dehalococcoidia bacterium]|nr:zinc ribbon domain-containing protein [Dehalococcoidia bacterium]